MKIVFLDVDGVLNNKRYIEKCYRRNGHKPMSMYCTPFDPYNLKNLAKIVRKTDAKIVLTSTWRLDDKHMAVLRARLAEYGLQIHDTTDSFIESGRANQIIEWLRNHKYIENYIIIDDECFDISIFFKDKNILQINPEYGLTFGDRIKAIKKLKGDK